MSNRRVKKRIVDILVYVFLTLALLLLLLPLFSMIGTAVKTKDKAMATVALFPELKEVTFENFFYVLARTSFGNNMLNSLIVSICVTILCIFCASLCGYAISRFHGAYFKMYSVLLLLLQMFPAMLMLMPQYLIYTRLGIINNLTSVIISYTTGNLAFGTWLLKGFFDSIPRELEGAAQVDGCTQFKAFYKVILPLCKPGVATVSIFTMLNSWNEYMLASVFLKKNEVMTMTVGLQRFVMQNGADWASLMAAATIATLPTTLFVLFAQRYLIEGMTAGAVKS